MNNIKNNYEFIEEYFKKEVQNEIKDSNERNKIFKKSEEIVSSMFSSENYINKNEKKFLLVGKVQSGKTINFISIIVEAFKKGVNFIIILTSYDNSLFEQTLKRLKDTLCYEKNKNFLKFFSWTEHSKNKNLVKDLVDSIEKNNLNILVSTKNNISKINKILLDSLNSKTLIEKNKILIIDDEGDLGSATHSANKDSATFKNLSELINRTDSYYLSVTATPQVHLVMNHKKELKPDRVFVIEPGNGYNGLEYFYNNKDNSFEIMEKNIEEKWWSKSIFKEAVLYYILTSAYLLQQHVFEQQTHSNMLIHTDKENYIHEDTKCNVEALISDYRTSFETNNKNSYEYLEFIEKLKKIISKYDLDIELNEEYLNYFSYALKNTNINMMNQKDKFENNAHFNQIVIGSNLVGRGITFDNLLVTFFTNRAKDKSAIDTLLQRARWFGYRKDILEHIKIFTTQKIYEDFENIYNVENKIWPKLKEADQNKWNFADIEFDLGELIGYKLKMTNKAPTSKRDQIFENGKYNLLSSYNGYNFESLFNSLVNSNLYFKASKYDKSKYEFKMIELNSFNDIYKFIDKNFFIDILEKREMDLQKINEFVNLHKKLKIVLLDLKTDNKNQILPRTRSLKKIENDYEFINIFQGKNFSNTNKENIYIGDKSWHELEGEENTVFVQIHFIKPTYQNIEKETIKVIYLDLPKTLK